MFLPRRLQPTGFGLRGPGLGELVGAGPRPWRTAVFPKSSLNTESMVCATVWQKVREGRHLVGVSPTAQPLPPLPGQCVDNEPRSEPFLPYAAQASTRTPHSENKVLCHQSVTRPFLSVSPKLLSLLPCPVAPLPLLVWLSRPVSAGSSEHPSGRGGGPIRQSREPGVPRLHTSLGRAQHPSSPPAQLRSQPPPPTSLPSVPFILPGPPSSCHVTTCHLA